MISALLPVDGYKAAQPILETAILAANSNFLKQSTEEGFLAATLLYRLANSSGLLRREDLSRINSSPPGSWGGGGVGGGKT